jgi:hypothetical protein
MRSRPTGPARPATPAEIGLFLGGLGVAIGYVAALALMFVAHDWLLDARNQPVPTDFVAIWSAGRLALGGAALAAYDGARQHAAEVVAVGHDFPGLYGWPYPPSFFFVAQSLARLPYAWAFTLGVGFSFALHGLSLAAITRRLASVAVACAAPWALACAMVGQNGFLTAGLIALVLLTLDERPALSGILLGLLTYKPHFGLLFPLALAASGRWRAFAWAAASAVGLTALSIGAYGPGVFAAFLRGLPLTTQTLVSNGAVGWNRLESVYGLARALGASNAMGWVAQGLVSLAGAASVVWIWRGRAPLALKAAGLAVAAVLVTPYVFAYDLPVLSVAAAFLYRQRPFDRVEAVLLGVAVLTFVPLAFVAVPTGLFASLAIAAAVGRRALAGKALETATTAPGPAIAA